MHRFVFLPIVVLAFLASGALAREAAELPDFEQLEGAELDSLYAQAILSETGIDRLLDGLDSQAQDASRSLQQRANTHLAAAHLNWRHGRREAALASAEDALDVLQSADALLVKARLLDAAGDQEQAAAYYERAEAGTEDEEERAFIRLRLTMLETDERNIEALRTLAEERDQVFRNRAAITLAVLGHPEVAIELFQPDQAAAKPFVEHARLADWAIEAENYALAQVEAWQAYEKAEFINDQRYALAVVVESYRQADQLDVMLDELAERGALNEDLLRLRIDTLIETERLDDAIELYLTLTSAEADADARQRLINLYAAAGRTEEMVEEYRRLMASEAKVVHWYNGLAAHSMNNAQPEAALEIWQLLEARNQEAIGVLLEGGALMEQMGFVDETIAMIERYMSARGDDPNALLFLFDTYLDRGDQQEALVMLERLDELLPPAASERRSLADAYERLDYPQEAVRVYEEIRETLGELGYDERSRLAWLYSVAGRKQDALAAWQEIWVDVVSPARRSFAESQMLLLAAELSMLGDMAVELEQKLYLEQADRNEIDLLVRIYTEVGDKISATEVIDEYAQQSEASELERLEQLGRVYMLLEDFSSYDKVLRRLYEIDGPRRLDHIRGIILNLLSHDLATESSERFDDIRHWLTELRSLDEEAVSGEFEASIYSMGAFQPEAVKSYRRALVERPEVSDNLLLMADLLKNMDRRDEAVAILQYVAENAKDDNEFVVAIDGLINMVGARTFRESLNNEIRSIFEWTKRVTLERIAGVSDKFYLYTLLSEIAQETEDGEGAFVAVENSLPLAGVRRSAILRELVTMSTPDAGFAGFNTGRGDLRRQLKHGRRLVLLGEQLPPEVYIDLGKGLLAKDDFQAASRAFDMINDITGLIDVNRTKGEIFLEEGFAEEALEWFNRALSVNQDDLALLLNTALLFEREGRDEVAWRRYFLAIKGLLLRQPFELRAERRDSSSVSRYAAITGQQVDTSVTPDYRKYYEVLAQGLLVTWPTGRAQGAAAIQELEEAFEAELEAVLAAGGDALQPLAKYSRLDHLAMFLRRIAARTGNALLAARIDNRLLVHFASDASFTASALKSARDLWGGSGVAKHFAELEAVEQGTPPAENPAQPLQSQMALAEAREDFRTQLALARVAGKEYELFELFRTEIEDGNYRLGLGYARALLPEQSYERLVRSLAPTLKDDSKAFLELITEQAEILIDAEERFAIKFANVSEVFNLLTDKQQSQDEGLLFVVLGAEEGRWSYFAQKADFEDRIRLLEVLAEGSDTGEFGVSADLLFVGHGIREMLTEPLAAESQDALFELVLKWLSQQDLRQPFSIQDLSRTFLAFEAHEQNLPLVYRMAGLFKERSPNAEDFEPLLRDYFEGDGEATLRGLVDLNLIYFAGDHLAEAKQRSLEALGSGEQLDAELALFLYTMEHRSYGRRSSADENRRKADLLQRLLQLYPEETQYRLEWAKLQLNLGNARLASQALEDCYEALPEDEYVRAAFYFHLLAEQQYARAQLVNSDGGSDLSDPEVAQELLQTTQNRGAYLVYLATGQGLFSTVAQDQLRAMGFAASYQWQPVEEQLDLLYDSITAGDDGKAQQALRGVWRAVATPVDQDSRPLYGNPLAGAWAFTELAFSSVAGWGMSTQSGYRFQDLLRTPSDEEPPLFQRLANFSFAATEFDAYASTLPEDGRQSFKAIYESLVAALIANGGAETRLDELSRLLLEGDLSDHGLRVWMMLVDELDAKLQERHLESFKARIAEVASPSDLEVLLIARIFAQTGETETAARYYLLLAAHLMPQNEFPNRQENFQRFVQAPPRMNLLAFVGEISERLPQPLAMDIAERVFSIAREIEDDEEFKNVYHTFLLTALTNLFPVSDILAQVERISPDLAGVEESESGGVDQPFVAPRGIELARIHAMSGDFEAALRVIHGFFARSGEAWENAPPEGIEQYERSERLQRAARAYGLAHYDGLSGTIDLSAAEEIVFRRNRLFPLAADEDDYWRGAEDWAARAASDMLDWLEVGSVRMSEASEALLVAIYQLHRGGQVDAARSLFGRFVSLVTASGDEALLLRLSDLVLASRHFEVPLPSALVAEALKRDLLDVEQAAAALRRYAELESAEQALRLVVEIMPDLESQGGLALLREVRALAQESGRKEDSIGISERIEALEDAKRELGVVGA